MKTQQQNLSLINWLIFTAFMVLAMAVIGAITRLTESGLSMVEWRPLIGAIPPLNEAEWERVFALYKQIPEYTAQNSWMELSDFKRIFFWEWFHRLWGRLIGLVFALPLVYFWVRGHIPQGYKGRLLFLLFLGGMQGVMGWYMVRSGLSELTSVSHYRLAAHLFLAVIVFACLVWTIFDLKHSRVQWSWDNFCLKRHGLISLGFLYVTIIWGAFVAGLDGGMIYNTWPMMGDGLIPDEAAIKGAFHENPAGAQFFHRWIAMATGFVILTYAMRVKSKGLAIMLFVQIGLGILTLISQVAIPLAALHQASAFILVAVLLQQIHKSFR
ncbi:MAG: COX15/CtaA family protein [Bdellovibrionales bacterium]